MTQISAEPRPTSPSDARRIAESDAWLGLKAAASEFQGLQLKDGSVAEPEQRVRAGELVDTIVDSIQTLRGFFAHEADYLDKLVADLRRWAEVPAVVAALGDSIDELYWKSIDRPKLAHWLAAYELVSATVTPHPASVWAKGPQALPLTAPLREITDQVMDDEFPLSMFYEALSKKMTAVIESTRGMTGADRI